MSTYNYDMTSAYAEKVIIVTGGGSGIGAELCRQLTAMHATVIAISKSKPDKPLDCVTYFTSDLAEIKQVAAIYDQIIARYKHIDYVFNVAGTLTTGEIVDTPLADWHSMIRDNVTSTINSTHAAYQQMVLQWYGHIINVGSAAGLFPVPSMLVYGTSKYAVTGLTVGLMVEARSHNVRVSLVAPTVVNTPLYDKATHQNFNVRKVLKYRRLAQSPEKAVYKILKGVARNRPIIVTATYVRLAWVFYRLMPFMYLRVMYVFVRVFQKYLKKCS